MSALETITAFTTIISLLGQFQSGRTNVTQNDFNNFIELLESNHLPEIKNLILSNQNTTSYIKSLLNRDIPTIKGQLDYIEQRLMSLTSAIDGFSDLGRQLGATTQISDQSIHILRQLDEKGASSFLVIETDDGYYLPLDAPNNTTLNIPSSRFLMSDLNDLVSLDFLLPNSTSSETPRYVFTRKAEDLVKTLEPHKLLMRSIQAIMRERSEKIFTINTLEENGINLNESFYVSWAKLFHDNFLRNSDGGSSSGISVGAQGDIAVTIRPAVINNRIG